MNEQRPEWCLVYVTNACRRTNLLDWSADGDIGEYIEIAASAIEQQENASPLELGLWLWEGVCEAEDAYEPGEDDFVGKFRRLRDHELNMVQNGAFTQ